MERKRSCLGNWKRSGWGGGGKKGDVHGKKTAGKERELEKEGRLEQRDSRTNIKFP